MHKSGIRTFCEWSCTDLRSKLCIANLWIVQVHTHAILDVFMCVLTKWQPIMRYLMLNEKNLPIHKRIKNKMARRSQAKETKSFLPGTIPAMDVPCASQQCTIIINQDQRDFQLNDSALPFLVQFRRIGFDLHISHFLGCNPRSDHPGQSKDHLLIHALHTSLGASWGLCSQSEDCYRTLISEVCAGQSMDCPNLYFSHYIILVQH